MRAAETILRPSLIFVQNSVCGPGFLTIPVCIFVFHLGPRSEPRRPEWAWRKQWAKTSIRNTWPCLFFIAAISFRPWAPRNVFIIKKHRVQHACFCFVLCFFVSFSYYVDSQRCLCTQMLKWFMAVYTFQPFSDILHWYRQFLHIPLFRMVSHIFRALHWSAISHDFQGVSRISTNLSIAHSCRLRFSLMCIEVQFFS